MSDAALGRAGGGRSPAAAPAGSFLGWLPSWPMVKTKQLELRRRRGLMVAVVLLILGLPVLVLGFRLAFHAFDPKSYGPAGSPGLFSGLVNPMAEFGFIVAATLGASAGTTDLADGVFRHLVITGRSRLSLYLARIPAGLSIVLPLVAVAFTALCLVTTYEGVPQPASVTVNGVAVPVNLSQPRFGQWLLQHPEAGGQAFAAVKAGPATAPSRSRQFVERHLPTLYAAYAAAEPGQLNPSVNEMAKIGLWLELDVAVGFLVGLGLGSLTGQRTLATILMVVLELIVTPILAANAIPYFLDGQRLFVGVAIDQLRPAALGAAAGGHGRILFGGRGALGIPPMPTWAMVAVIVGWIVAWTGLGAWRMVSRDA